MRVPGSGWAHFWAHAPADRRNHTGSDAKGPVVFFSNDGQMEPDAARRKRLVRTPQPGLQDLALTVAASRVASVSRSRSLGRFGLIHNSGGRYGQRPEFAFAGKLPPTRIQPLREDLVIHPRQAPSHWGMSSCHTLPGSITLWACLRPNPSRPSRSCSPCPK